MESKTIRILVLEDNPADLDLIREALDDARGARFAVTGVEQLRDALDLLGRERFDVILSDLHVPDSQGIDTFLRLHARSPDVPVLILTSSGGESIGVSAVQQGAQDFLVKGELGGRSLARAIQYALERHRLECRLKESTAELEAANRELESFSYSVSHDLRAPLRTIDGFSSIVLRDHAGSLPAEGQRYLGLVREGAQQMARLIDDLLTFAKTGRQPLARRTVALKNLVTQCLEEFREEIAKREIDVAVGELPDCRADPALLRQVFLNLLGNALKYTRKQARAKIEVGCRAENGEQVLYVKDNGVGFDMQHAGKLFGVFQRLHHKEDFEGTGVGLAIVQRVVHRHGGRVWAEAKPDKGATFYFTLGKDPA